MQRAVIFDMDGVISDTQRFHASVESKILKEHGVTMTPREITAKYAGVTDKNMFEEIFKNHQIYYPNIEKIIFRKWDVMGKIVIGKIKAIPHVIKLIKSLNQSGFKLAIASASKLSFISTVINELKIQDYFDTIVSAQEVQNGKPAPDIFLLAAKRLQIEPKYCLVIEDGKSGMIGAKSAGMKAIGLVKDLQKDWPADIVTTSLRNVSIIKIEEIID